jgi:hypothetical protein
MIEMTHADYDHLLMIFGYASSMAVATGNTGQLEMIVGFLNAVNNGNPDWRPLPSDPVELNKIMKNFQPGGRVS